MERWKQKGGGGGGVAGPTSWMAWFCFACGLPATSKKQYHVKHHASAIPYVWNYNWVAKGTAIQAV